MIRGLALLPLLLALASCSSGGSDASGETAADMPAIASFEDEGPRKDSEGETPMDKMSRFYAALEAYDPSGAEAIVMTPTIDASIEEMRTFLGGMAQAMGAGRAKTTPLEQHVKNDWALVITKTDFTQAGNEFRHMIDVYLYREDGVWKMTPRGVLEDPGVEPLIDDDHRALKEWYQQNFDALQTKYLVLPYEDEGEGVREPTG